MAGRWPEIVFSIIILILAVLHMFIPDDRMKIDSTTLILLAIAATPWLFPFLKSLTLPGGTVLEFREHLQQVEKKVDLIEKVGMLPGQSAPLGDGLQCAVPTESAAGEWQTDPNKGQFGGLPTSNGRVLEATITPQAGPDSAACKVAFDVRSTDPARPLEGKVTIFLHPTFKARRQFDIVVKDGRVEGAFTSWGAFTIGAVADEGATRLELDLAHVPGGTPKFYAS